MHSKGGVPLEFKCLDRKGQPNGLFISDFFNIDFSRQPQIDKTRNPTRSVRSDRFHVDKYGTAGFCYAFNNLLDSDDSGYSAVRRTASRN